MQVFLFREFQMKVNLTFFQNTAALKSSCLLSSLLILSMLSRASLLLLFSFNTIIDTAANYQMKRNVVFKRWWAALRKIIDFLIHGAALATTEDEL